MTIKGAGRIVASFDATGLDERRWNALAALGTNSVFQTYQWHRSWWTTFGSRYEPLEFVGAWPDRYGEGGVWTLNLYWTARIASGTPVPADDVAEVAWFAAADLPPWDEFAFENTVAVLTAWKAGR